MKKKILSVIGWLRHELGSDGILYTSFDMSSIFPIVSLRVIQNHSKIAIKLF